MTFKCKMNAYFKIMEQKGVSKLTYSPPFYRLLWKYGVNFQPPLLASFKTTLAVQTAYFFSFFAIILSILSFIFFYTNDLFKDVAAIEELIMLYIKLGFISLGYGLYVSWYCGQLKKKYDLPDWDDLAEECADESL